MGNVLLVDPDPVAQAAMKGVLARGSHRFAAVDSVSEAWEFIRENVKVDLVVVELKLGEENGLALIERLKRDCCLKLLPVVVYAATGSRDEVKRVLELHAQNFLLKPYQDDAVFTEIARAGIHPWRDRLFEEAGAFAQRTGIDGKRRRAMLEALGKTLEALRDSLASWASSEAPERIVAALKALGQKARVAGAWGALATLRELENLAAEGKWPEFKAGGESVEFCIQTIKHFFDPEKCPEGFFGVEEQDDALEEQARELWSLAAKEGRCPVIGWPQLQREMEGLSGCPVVDSVAASFQMAANGQPTSLGPLLDLVKCDPALTALVLIAANRLKKGKGDEGAMEVEETRMAVGLLGEKRLASLAVALETVEERRLLAPPLFSWPKLRMFELGTARMARFVCEYLEMPDFEAPAYTAGLIHDIGKLLLAKLHPHAFHAIYDFAQSRGMKLASAERYFMGATTHEMAARFGERLGLSKRFVNVMRGMDNPAEAAGDADLVAIISLARDFCRRNHVGFSGDTEKDDAFALEDTPEWAVLKRRVYLNFDMKKFERMAHLECQKLKRELLDRYSK